MSETERAEYNAYHRAWKAKRRSLLTVDEIAERRAKHAAYCREKKLKMSPAERERRRAMQTKWMANKRASDRPAEREKRRAWRRKKLAESPEFKLTEMLRRRLVKAVRRYGMKEAKPATMLLVGCTRTELRAHLEKQFKPGMTWKNYGYRGWHVDHIRPVSSFNLLNEDEMRACFHFTNLQPLWGILNMKKGNRFEALLN